MIDIRKIEYNSLGGIDCEINHPSYGWIPFTASPDDVEELGKNIYKELKEGKHGEIKPFEPYVPTKQELEEQVRNERSLLLQELDSFTTNPLRWEELTETVKTGLKKYRLDLLDVPQQTGFPETVKWPKKPTILE